MTLEYGRHVEMHVVVTAAGEDWEMEGRRDEGERLTFGGQVIKASLSEASLDRTPDFWLSHAAPFRDWSSFSILSTSKSSSSSIFLTHFWPSFGKKKERVDRNTSRPDRIQTCKYVNIMNCCYDTADSTFRCVHLCLRTCNKTLSTPCSVYAYSRVVEHPVLPRNSASVSVDDD